MFTLLPLCPLFGLVVWDSYQKLLVVSYHSSCFLFEYTHVHVPCLFHQIKSPHTFSSRTSTVFDTQILFLFLTPLPVFLSVCLSPLVIHAGCNRVDVSAWPDVNVFAGALKLYLRELPEPLFTYALYDPFVQTAR